MVSNNKTTTIQFSIKISILYILGPSYKIDTALNPKKNGKSEDFIGQRSM